MEELLPVVSDDLDWHESGHKTRTPADGTRHIGWNGRWYRLDMTSAHIAEVEAFLERYTRAGQPVEPPKVTRPRKRTMAEAISENEKKAEWARQNGYPVTTRIAGGYYFPVKTERAWQEAQNALGSSGPERDAGDRG